MRKSIFKEGDTKHHSFVVKSNDFASFGGKTLHKVCSTYKLGQEMEWSSRLFMLDLIEANEEGVGTMLHIDHLSPAFANEKVDIIAIFKSFEQNHLLCDIEVKVGGRLIAKGQTGQKLLSKDKLKEMFPTH